MNWYEMFGFSLSMGNEQNKSDTIYQAARLAIKPMLTGRVVTQHDVDIFEYEQEIERIKNEVSEAWGANELFGAMRP